jgi:hypothetical protein
VLKVDDIKRLAFDHQAYSATKIHSGNHSPPPFV